MEIYLTHCMEDVGKCFQMRSHKHGHYRFNFSLLSFEYANCHFPSFSTCGQPEMTISGNVTRHPCIHAPWSKWLFARQRHIITLPPTSTQKLVAFCFLKPMRSHSHHIWLQWLIFNRNYNRRGTFRFFWCIDTLKRLVCDWLINMLCNIEVKCCPL